MCSSSYNQTVAASTHISDSLFDHVYIHQEFLKELNMQNVTDICFSEHNAVKYRFV